MVRLGSRRVLALALAAVLCSAAAVAAAGDKVHQPAGLPSELANPGGPPFLALGLGHMHNQTSGYGSSDSANVIFLNGSYTMTLLKQGGAELVEGARCRGRRCCLLCCGRSLCRPHTSLLPPPPARPQAASSPGSARPSRR